MLVISDYGLNELMKGMIYQLTTVLGAKLHLYQNNVTPSRTSVLADFTLCTFDGYAPVTIPAWPTPSVTAHVSKSEPTPITFTKSAGATTNNVYGYLVTDSTGTSLLYAEKDTSGPVAMNATGDQYTVALQNSHQNDPSAP